MASTSGGKENNIWPLPKFVFNVNWGTINNSSFAEISGLDTETQVTEYRTGKVPTSSAIKKPGISKVGNVTMKSGVFVNDDTFRDWCRQIKNNTAPRADVVIRLLNEKGVAAMMWTLHNARPVKIVAPTIDSDGNEAAVQSIEVAHEGITVVDPGNSERGK